MSVLNLPDPVNWSTGGRRLLWVTVGVVVFVVLVGGLGIRELTRGESLTALVIFGIVTPFVLTLIAVHRVAGGRTSLRTVVDSAGTTLLADRGFSVLLLISLGIVIPVGIIVVVGTFTGDLTMFPSAKASIAAAVLMGSATVIAVAGLISAWRRGGIGYVKLTPTGVEIADILRTKSVAWSEIVSIEDRSDSKKTRKAVVLKHSDGTESIIDGTDCYAPNGAGLYWMVRHYWAHVGDRAELEDGRAMQRLSEGRFDLG